MYIAETNKLYTIDKDLILPAAMVETLIGENEATELKTIPLPNNILERRIDEMRKGF